MPLKMRMMRRMMVSDQTGFDTEGMISNSKQIKNEEKNPPLTPLGTDDSNNYNSSANHSNITVRVCSDCHTTKTPLWRSGPKGPKVYNFLYFSFSVSPCYGFNLKHFLFLEKIISSKFFLYSARTDLQQAIP